MNINRVTLQHNKEFINMFFLMVLAGFITMCNLKKRLIRVVFWLLLQAMFMNDWKKNGTAINIHTYIHTLLRIPSTGLFSHNVNYYIILVIKKRKENLFTVVQLNSKYIQNYSKYIQNYLVWNILLKSLRLKLSISLVFLIEYRSVTS